MSPGGHLAQRQLDIGTFFGQQDAEPQLRCSMKSGDLYPCVLGFHRTSSIRLMRTSDKEMAPQELQLPGTRPTEKGRSLWTREF